jgi:hypothetical protein
MRQFRREMKLARDMPIFLAPNPVMSWDGADLFFELMTRDHVDGAWLRQQGASSSAHAGGASILDLLKAGHYNRQRCALTGRRQKE